MRGGTVNTAKTIKELRESIGMSRKEFSEHTGIPVRTLEFLGLWEQLHNSTFKGSNSTPLEIKQDQMHLLCHHQSGLMLQMQSE